MNDISVELLRQAVGTRRRRRCEVTARDIRRFAQSIGEPIPAGDEGDRADDVDIARRSEAATGITAPALFCQTLMYEDVNTDRLPADGSPMEFALPIDGARTVGGSSEFVIDRHVRAGDVIDVESTIRDVYQKQGSAGRLYMIVVETVFTDAAGGQVASERATYIKRV